MGKRQTKVDTLLQQYCKANNIKLLIDPALKKDDGLCYPEIREIYLAKSYSSEKIKMACCLHEIGHIRVEKMKVKPFDNFDCEYASWFEAIKLHLKLTGKSFCKSQAEYMLKCLKTYCNDYSDFKKNVIEDED